MISKSSASSRLITASATSVLTSRFVVVLAPGLPIKLMRAPPRQGAPSPERAATAHGLLGEMEELLIKVFSALQKRESPYASVLAAVIELAGGSAHAVALAPEPALDESWAEPAAFDGCSTQGQAKPGSPQPIHIVRKNSAGVSA